MKKMNGIPKTVIKLGFLSLFTDMSSEMIFPLLPVFLASLPGGGPLVLGIIEGIAESTASLLKLVSGLWTDKIKKRTPFVTAGYGLASVVRPLIAFAYVWPVVLVLRFLDRVGKGLRSSPRDALIAESVLPGKRGAAFAFQRMMDHTGAVTGPAIAAILMGLAGFSIRHVMMFAAVPSIVVIAIITTLKEPAKSDTVTSPEESYPEHSIVTRDYSLLLLAVFVFTLGNSTDAFLLMRLSEAGVATHYVATLWGFHHLLKIAGAWIGGHFSDKFGRKTLMFTGFGLYAFIYALFGIFESENILMCVFIVYGLSIGILEPTERAWVSELSGTGKHGTAFGLYHAAKGFGALPASIMFGLFWIKFGQFTAFMTGAMLALAAAGVVVFIKEKRE